jgi:membrane-associated protease RseP (regulator of RpoE activity)
MNTAQTLVLLVLAGVIVFEAFRFKRYFIFFLIKTQRGLALLDYAAALLPGFWGFMADAAVVVSFGGVGGAYLAKNNHNVNLYRTLFFVGVIAIVFHNPGWTLGIALAVVLASAMVVLAGLGGVFAGFASATVLLYLLISPILNASYIEVLTSVLGASAMLMTGLAKHALDIALGASNLPGVSPLLPGSRGGMKGVVFPGYDIFVPWWFAVVAFAVTLLAHESAHGIVARVHRIRVKSAGILTAGLIPIGAFVEPDDADLNGRHGLTKMRVFAAGSFANFVVGSVAGMLILAAAFGISSLAAPDGMEIVGTVEGYPAHGLLKVGDVIKSVNGASTTNLSAFRSATSDITPGDELVVETQRGSFSIRSVPYPGNETQAYIGIEMVPHYDFGSGFVEKHGSLVRIALFVLGSLYWIAFFNINVGLVNLLPLYPFDGWRMLREIVKSFSSEMGILGRVGEEALMASVLVFTLLLFAVNAYPLLVLAAS